MTRHPLLDRQLRRLGLAVERPPTPSEWQALLSVVGDTYIEADQDRRMLEHSLDVSSAEMVEMYQRQKSALETRLHHLAGIIERSPVVAITRRNLPGRPIEFVSGNITRFGYTPDDFITGKIAYSDLVHPEDRPELEEQTANALAQGAEDYQLEYRVQHGDGHWMWVSDHTWLTRDATGAVTAIHGVLLDMTERKLAERALRDSEQHHRTLANAGSALIWTSGTDMLCNYFNEPWLRFTGRTLEQERGNGWASGIHPEDVEGCMHTYMEAFQRRAPFSMEYRLRHADGSYRWLLDEGNPRYDSNGIFLGYIGFCYDITAQKEYQRQLEHVAHYDVLTDLPNRMLLAERLRQAMARVRRNGRHLAVAYIDLDGFKAINDTHGHAVGDRLLVEIAGRLRQCLREGDTIARLGGDEFVTIVADLPDTASSLPLMERLLSAAAQPVLLNGTTLQVSSSIGIAYYSAGDDADAEQLVRHADQAMYQAKQAGKNRFQVFDAEADRAARGRHATISRIRHGLQQGEFVLYYQPKVNLRTGDVLGVEALIRWQHPQYGLLAPDAFLPEIADHSTAIAIGEWVIDTAITQADRWRQEGLFLPVSVNIGAHHLQHPDFVTRLRTLLGRHPEIRPQCIQLEILETSALDDIARVSEVITACAKIGIDCALDDFGTGYSPLTYLKQLPARVLKIDRSFVRDMLDDPDSRAIINGVLGLAASFEREVIAEGVETIAHGAALLELGCEVGQGYGIARPMPAADVSAWIASWQLPESWGSQP